MQFTFGADPEFMLYDSELTSAISFLPDKDSAKVINGHKFYYDNVLAEIALKPTKTRQETIDGVKEAFKTLAKKITPCKFEIKASSNYPNKELKSEEAKMAACNPEWDVYSLQIIEPSKDYIAIKEDHYEFITPFRTAGGHIHLGSEQFKDMLTIFNTLRMMDLFIGIPSIFLDTDSTSKARRKAYGQAGSHRIPDYDDCGYYGLEYRSLGNFWFSSPDHIGLIYDLTNFVLQFVENKGYEKFWVFNEDLLKGDDISVAHTCFGYDLKSLKKAINSCDKKLAEKFMVIVNNYLPEPLVKEIERLSGQSLPDPYEAWEIHV